MVNKQYNFSAREKARRALEAQWQRDKHSMLVRVRGGSMGLTLPSGCDVRIQFGTDIPLKRGDIVYFRKGEVRVAHRIVVTFWKWFVERGDDNLFPAIIWKHDVIGKCVSGPLYPPDSGAPRATL